jgi:8-oxo-dGTP pyrophosphatase MutT (NUDIX family)
MHFTQKIYFNDKQLILTTDKEAVIRENPGFSRFIFFHGASLRHYTQVLLELGKPGVKGAIIEDSSGDSLLDRLRGMYHSIEAAGGVAYNEDGDILMIYRRGKWDLPKGKLDKGESIEECALREVSEETGLQNLALDEKICDTYHVYDLDKEHILKRTAWYKMKGSSRDKLMPQEAENIMEARWVKEKDLAPLAEKSYEAIREVLILAGLKWEGK